MISNQENFLFSALQSWEKTDKFTLIKISGLFWDFLGGLQTLFSFAQTVPASTHCSETGNYILRFTESIPKALRLSN